MSSRRKVTLIVLAFFVPLTLWYASRFSDLPVLSFTEAEVKGEEGGKVLVEGQVQNVLESHGDDDHVAFMVTDKSGTTERVVYDGSKELDVDALKKARASKEQIEVAGHICSDKDGQRFHASYVSIAD